jgi:hypothetical protein
MKTWILMIDCIGYGAGLYSSPSQTQTVANNSHLRTSLSAKENKYGNAVFHVGLGRRSGQRHACS